MGVPDRQSDYWNRVAEEKEFTHPLDAKRLRTFVSAEARVLDVGCGYGRTVADLSAAGWVNVIGVDIAENMIRRGRRLYPDADLLVWPDGPLPFEDATCDAALLFAVLTCIPSDDAQRALVADMARVLRPGGILYVSDYPIQCDDRNQRRYERFAPKHGTFGVFELPDGAVLRHQTMVWLDELLSPFERLATETMCVPTMNGNPSNVVQCFCRKREGV